MDKIRDTLLKKPEASNETCRKIFYLHSDKLLQTKDSENKDVSTQTNTADIVLLRKMKSVRNSKQIFDISQRAVDSPLRVEDWNSSNGHNHDGQESSSNYSYSTNDESLTKYDIDYENESLTKYETDYENWKNPNDLVD